MVDERASRSSHPALRTVVHSPWLSLNAGVGTNDYYPAATSKLLSSARCATLTTMKTTSAARGVRLGCASTAAGILLIVVWLL